MERIVNPAICSVYNMQKANAFCRIKYEDGVLSITGVIGPTKGGNCIGSAGQCYDEIAKGIPTNSWTKEMLNKFIDIWKEWHLNDMHPACEHQREQGWEEEAKQKVTIYHYRLTKDANEKKKAAEKAAADALKKGETFTPSEEQTTYAKLPYSVASVGKILESSYYEPAKPLYKGDTQRATEIKPRGFIEYDKDPIGILCKPCPICGYKYGTAWHKKDVPQDIIDWLFNLPESTIKPYWV